MAKWKGYLSRVLFSDKGFTERNSFVLLPRGILSERTRLSHKGFLGSPLTAVFE